MSRMKSVIVPTLLMVGLATGAAGQWNVERFGRDQNRVYATQALEPALVTSLGYGRVVSPFDHFVQLVGDVGLVTPHMNTSDFRVRLGAQTSVIRWRSMHLSGTATFITRGTENSIYRGFSFGADLTGALGVYRNQWFAAGEFGKDKSIVTHVTHTDWYRTHFYADAKDGWYLDGGGTYHYGLAAGLTVQKVELIGRFGWRRTEEFNEVTPPMYATLGVGLGL